MNSAANDSPARLETSASPVAEETVRSTPLNPTASSRGETAPLRPSRQKLQYFVAFRYLFEHREWPQTLALGSLCYFIPVFGQVALLGYYYEIVERLHRDAAAPCPTFEFRRFAVYAARGVWSYLLVLAVSSLLQPVLQIPLQYTIFGIMIAFQSSNTTGTIVAVVSAVVWLAILAVVFALMFYVVQPLMLRGGLSQDLGSMFRPRWVVDYVKRIWLQVLLVQAVLLAAMCLLLPLGALMFCIGLLPVSMWLAVAGAHLTSQLYELALDRGCPPVPLRPSEADMPPVAFAPAHVGGQTAEKLPPDYPTSPNSSASP